MIVAASVHSDTGGKLGEVSRNEGVVVLEPFGKPAHHTGEWVKIAAGDLEGWVHASAVEAPYGHGGARPNSGPLPSRVSFHAFSHAAKGRTHSAVTVHIQRCNTCGAMGRTVVEAESLFDYDAPADGGFSGPQPESIADEPLIHKPGCEFGPA